VAEQAIAAIQRNPADAALASDALKQAKAALARAHDMHGAGDHVHAALLELVAREWAEMASDVVRAAKVEQHASQLEVDANDAEQKSLRAQALIEETLARRNRAKERLEQIKNPPKADKAPPPKADKAPPPKADKAAPAKAGGTP
jgi:colicin import membrane protein